jgi:hypothetical protein
VIEATRRRWRPEYAVDALVLGLLAGIAGWNAFAYPSFGGYDAAEHLEYAHAFLERGTIGEGGAFYTPPGFYALAAAAIQLGRWLGLDEPEHLVQLLNALLAVATALLLVVLARLLFPGRRLLRWTALGFFVACPLVLKTAAMFHPQTLAMLLSTAALTLAAWMIVRRRYAWWAWLALAALLGLGQLVRSVTIFTAVVVLLTFAAVAVWRREDRRPVGRALAVVAAFVVLIPLPWYVHLQVTTGSSVFGRGGSTVPLWDRWPAAFYLSPGLPDVLTHPQRESLPPRFLPLLYVETWGDYYGIWSWGPSRPELTSDVNRRLVWQSVVGAPLTLVAVSGWVALLALALTRVRQRAEQLLVALLPGIALAGTLFYAVRNPTPDGDVVKGLFMLTAVPAWALSFGFALDVLAASRRWLAAVVGAVLAVCAVVALSYAVA